MTRRILIITLLIGMVLGVLAGLIVKGHADAQADAVARTQTVTLEFSDRYRLTPIGPLVQAYSRSWIIHVDMVLDDGRLLGATPGGGVRVRPWTMPGRFARYTVAVSPDQKAAILAYAMAQVGKPYDFVNLFGFALKSGEGSGDRAFICGELEIKAMRAGGVDLAPGKNAEQVTPAQIAKSPLLTPVAS